MKKEYPIPEFCKADCMYRDKKAKYMPACQYAFKLAVDEKGEKCLTYKPGA
ncbi:MAG: hypothetical protein ABSG90_12855 [Dehalococcoidia bacterium]